VNEQSNRLVRDPSTGETVWLEPSTGDLDLTTLPERLDDTTLAMVEDLARRPLSALPPCDNRHLGQCLRMMLAVLPRRQADELSGELFVAAYERHLGGYPNEAITHLCDEAIRTCKWFPTVTECIETLTGWRRTDEAVRRQSEAQRLASRERGRRRDEEWRARALEPQPPITQADVDAMAPKLIEIGISCGALVRDADGNVGPAPEEAA
jgi:hypothetical protein